MNENFKGVWIPAEIFLSDDLTAQEKLMFGIIQALNQDNKGCYASNAYFGKLFKVSNTRISQMIKSLIDKGFIEANYVYNENQECEKRILKIIKGGIKEMEDTSPRKPKGGIKEMKDTSPRKPKVYNIDNNIDNNIVYSSSSCKVNEGAVLNKEEEELLQFFKINFDKRDYNVNLFKELFKDYDLKTITEALEISLERGGRSLSYVRKVLEDWKQRGVNKLNFEDNKNTSFAKEKKYRSPSMEKFFRMQTHDWDPEYIRKIEEHDANAEW
ncbi:hypothetical protein AN644_00170 [Candidatus Epulonipiscium fishelsonii]|nr:hypothetical protein AN644_00170 [Epulopiscium sp. SCG-C06WGA-EpuloA1]